jgi:hypothetical protein
MSVATVWVTGSGRRGRRCVPTLGGPTLISQQARCITVLSPLLSEMIPMTDKDMLFLAGLAGFAWWTYLFLPLVWFHS